MVVYLDEDTVVYNDSWYCWKRDYSLLQWRPTFAKFVTHGHVFQVRLSNPTVFSTMKLFMDGLLVQERSAQIGPITAVKKGQEVLNQKKGFIMGKLNNH